MITIFGIILIILFIIVGITYIVRLLMNDDINPNVEYKYDIVNGLTENINIDDPLVHIRDAQEIEIKQHYSKNKVRDYLINANCEARLLTFDKKDHMIFVRGKTKMWFARNYFEVKGNNEHVCTMWAVFDSNFKISTKYSDLKKLYFDINKSQYTTNNGLKYFQEPLFNKLPPTITNKFSENEYCYMKYKLINDKEHILECSEIWSENFSNQQQKFYIISDKLTLFGILSDFAKKKHKCIKFKELLKKYSKLEKGKVIYNNKQINNTKTKEREQTSHYKLNKERQIDF